MSREQRRSFLLEEKELKAEEVAASAGDTPVVHRGGNMSHVKFSWRKEGGNVDEN